MEPLAGWTVAVTAERRAADQAAMLQQIGATVVLAPVLRSERCDDDALRAVTDALVREPPDLVVATTAIGMRAWIASAWSWGRGEAMLGALRAADVVARGSKASGALLSEAVDVGWRAPGQTMAEVCDHLLASGVRGQRIAVQGHGGDISWFTTALVEAGAEVVEVAVYRWARPESTQPVARLAQAIVDGEIDAVTFTSPPAVAGFLELVGPDARRAMHDHDVVAACVGPVTAAAAIRAGLSTVTAAEPSRLGPMVRALGERLADRAVRAEMAGMEVHLQGAQLAIGSHEVRLTPRERKLLHALVGASGAVLSKQALAAVAWDGPVEDHAVEVAVNRLRRKLGAAAPALETSNRRGYRLARREPAHRRSVACEPNVIGM